VFYVINDVAVIFESKLR